jgi:CRP-like cAMP-binding protein
MRHSGDANDYELPMTQTELAGWVGATRESTARALAAFRRAGFVSTSRGRIVVHEVEALSAAVAG